MDSGCTLGARAEKDMNCFHDTRLLSTKVYMLPDKSKIKVTKKMQFKHNLHGGAGEMNIIPNMHSTPISVLKMADQDYITRLDITEARIYNGNTTIIAVTRELHQ